MTIFQRQIIDIINDSFYLIAFINKIANIQSDTFIHIRVNQHIFIRLSQLITMCYVHLEKFREIMSHIPHIDYIRLITDDTSVYAGIVTEESTQ